MSNIFAILTGGLALGSAAAVVGTLYAVARMVIDDVRDRWSADAEDGPADRQVFIDEETLEVPSEAAAVVPSHAEPAPEPEGEPIRHTSVLATPRRAEPMMPNVEEGDTAPDQYNADGDNADGPTVLMSAEDWRAGLGDLEL